MASPPKFATVRETKMLSADTRQIDFEMRDQDLGFVGGQYIIMDSRLTLPNGKPAKRAYSIITPDTEQRNLTLVVKRVGEGLCSNYLHQVQPGDELRFSGPWGKFKIVDEAPAGEILVAATDSGITAVLGFLRAQTMAPALGRTRVLWMRTEGEIISNEQLMAWLPEGCASVEIHAVPPVHHPERLSVAVQHLDQARANCAPQQVFMAGDGAVLLPYAETLNQAGIETPKERVECFFNMPKKSSS